MSLAWGRVSVLRNKVFAMQPEAEKHGLVTGNSTLTTDCDPNHIPLKARGIYPRVWVTLEGRSSRRPRAWRKSC